MDLRPYQAEGINAIREHFRNGFRKVLLWLATGGGKCLGRGTPVMLASGQVVPVEEVQAGDSLMGPDSKPRRVLSTTNGRGPLFKITPVKGDPWICNDVHVITLQHCQSEEVVDIPLNEYLLKGSTFKNEWKLFRVPVDFPARDPVGFDPYLAGIWLGDGSIGHPCVTVSLKKPQTKEYLLEYAEKYGYQVRVDPGRGCEMIWLCRPEGQRQWRGNGLREAMKEFVVEGISGSTYGERPNAKAKRIPDRYLTASRKERELLLAGMMDSDGCVSRSGWDWISASQNLALQLCFLARSLGLAAYMTPSKKRIKSIGFEGIYFRVSIHGDCAGIPCRVNRPPPRVQKKSVLRTGISVTPGGDGDYFGFTLDGDGRFLLGDFTVTHNTHCFSFMMIEAVAKNRRCIMLVRGRKLVDQASKRLVRERVPHGVMMRGHWNFRPTMPIQLCSIDTLIARGWRPPADLIVIDEVHQAVSDGYREFLKDYPDAFVVGVTATPYSHKSLEHVADTIVHPITMSELISIGFLVNARYFAPDEPNVTGVRVSKSTGDYVQEDLAALMDKSAITGDIIHHWKKLAENRPTLCFAVSVEHSKHIAAQFSSAGIPAAHCDADTPEPEREKIIAQLENGEIKVVSNVGIFCTGVDIPCVSCIVMARPTKSYNLYIQQAGRGTRIHPGKENFILLDHAGNVLRHGYIVDEPEPDLKGRKQPEGQNPRIRRCEACFALVEEFPCPSEMPVRDDSGEVIEFAPCGWKPEPKAVGPRSVLEVAGDLKELTGPSPMERYECERFCEEQLDKVIASGRNPWSAYYKTAEKFGDHAARMVFFRLCKRHNIPLERKKKEVPTDGFPFK